MLCVLGDSNDEDECRCVSADVQISADAQIRPQISAQSISHMQRSVQVLRSMCVVVCVWVWVFVGSVDVCICVHVSVSVCCVCVSADARIWFTNLENNNMESGFLTALGFKWFLRASVQNLRNL